MYRSKHIQLTHRALALCGLLLAALATPTSHAQLGANNPDVIMEVLPGAVFPNQRVKFVLRVSDVELTAAPEIPDIRGATLRVAQSGQSNVNGKTYLTFLYILIANQPGTVEISPFTLQTANGTTRTQPFTFTVLDDAPLIAAKNAGKKAFVIPSVPTRSVYQRESFIAHLTLFYDPRVDVASNTIPEFESKGYAIDTTNSVYQDQALIDGTRFNFVSYPIEITPIEAGTLRIASPTMNMMAYEQGRSNSIFSTRQGVPFAADGIDATFDVKPLPKAPDGFSGAVGDYIMDVTLPKVPTTVGDPVEVEMRVKGTGKEEFVSAPILDDPDENWKIYDMGESRTVSEDGTILFRKVLRPTKPTNQIPPFVFTFFDPNKERYVSLASEPDELPWNLANFPTGGNQTPITSIQQSPTIADAEISFPSLESPRWIAKSAPALNLKTINLVGGGLTLIALLALLISKCSTLKIKNNEARQLLHTASKKSNPLQLRLHALLAARALLYPDHELEGDWQTLAEIHDRLSYAPGKISDPSDKEVAHIETLFPNALQSLRQQEATQPEPKTFISTTALVALCCALGIQKADADTVDNSQLLTNAKQAIAEQNWTAATEAFTAIHKAGNYSPETLLAEGASYAKLQQPARAKASFAQALATDFTTLREVQRNLTLIDTSPAQQANIKQLALIAFPKQQLIAALFTAFWLCVLSLIARKLLRQRWIANIALTLSSIIFLALAACTMYLQTLPDSHSVAILITDDTLRNVPLESSAPGAPIAGGELATAIEKSGAFVLLEQLNDPQNRGWVKAGNIVPLTPSVTNFESN